MPGPAARVHASRSPFAAALRTWRTARKLSQEELAARAGVSTRHLSFVENGRSRPSRELTSALGQALDLPLRERNQLLLAAGFAPGYERMPLGSEALRGLRRALDYMLTQQEPFGAVVVDRAWNVLEMNVGARRVFGREVQCREIMPVIFDFRPITNVEAYPRKDIDNLSTDDTQRMVRSDLLWIRR